MAYNIREIRRQRHITQEELARRSNVSRGTISALERGTQSQTTVKTLLKLANALDVDVGNFFANSV